MADNVTKKSGLLKTFKDSRGGAVLLSTPVIGLVKDNIDPTHSGRIRVYIAKYGSSNPDNSKSWITVKYLSPFFGTVSANNDILGSGNKNSYGDYLSVPHTYGFWGSSPSIGTRVVCIFINGNPNDGYYIGSAPTIGLNHMVPAIGSSPVFVPNKGAAEQYAGAEKLPVTEVNYSNPSIRNSNILYKEAKPIHQYHAKTLAVQGLIRDPVRGTISSSSQRETPSRVFGMSTPGGNVYQGGYTNATIDSAIKDADPSKLQVVGKTGGHTLVMDDGTINGKDQLMRLRTINGHMIMMNDSEEVITIIHANGKSWVELGKEGTVDVFSMNSVNIRTQGDLNLHADRDLNMFAGRNIGMYAKNSIGVESEKDINVRSGNNFSAYTMGTYTVKVDQQMSFASNGDSSFLSKSNNYQNGSMIYLNTGASATVPAIVPTMTKINHVDTTYSQSRGWMYPSPESLLSIASRTPTHMPWIEANSGVQLENE